MMYTFLRSNIPTNPVMNNTCWIYLLREYIFLKVWKTTCLKICLTQLNIIAKNQFKSSNSLAYLFEVLLREANIDITEQRISDSSRWTADTCQQRVHVKWQHCHLRGWHWHDCHHIQCCQECKWISILKGYGINTRSTEFT